MRRSSAKLSPTGPSGTRPSSTRLAPLHQSTFTYLAFQCIRRKLMTLIDLNHSVGFARKSSGARQSRTWRPEGERRSCLGFRLCATKRPKATATKLVRHFLSGQTWPEFPHRMTDTPFPLTFRPDTRLISSLHSSSGVDILTALFSCQRQIWLSVYDGGVLGWQQPLVAMRWCLESLFSTLHSRGVNIVDVERLDQRILFLVRPTCASNFACPAPLLTGAAPLTASTRRHHRHRGLHLPRELDTAVPGLSGSPDVTALSPLDRFRPSASSFPPCLFLADEDCLLRTVAAFSWCGSGKRLYRISCSDAFCSSRLLPCS